MLHVWSCWVMTLFTHFRLGTFFFLLLQSFFALSFHLLLPFGIFPLLPPYNNHGSSGTRKRLEQAWHLAQRIWKRRSKPTPQIVYVSPQCSSDVTCLSYRHRIARWNLVSIHSSAIKTWFLYTLTPKLRRFCIVANETSHNVPFVCR